MTRRPLSLKVAALLLLTTGISSLPLVYVFASKDRVGSSNIVSAVFGAITLFVTFAGWILRTTSAAPSEDLHDAVDEFLIDQLDRWKTELKRRGLAGALVPWVWSSNGSPSVTPADPKDHVGAESLFETIESSRVPVIIEGSAGSGKSSLLVLLLTRLNERGVEERPALLLPLNAWSVGRASLRRWVLDWIREQAPNLKGFSRASLERELFARRRIRLLLDGMDEVDASHLARAWATVLNEPSFCVCATQPIGIPEDGIPRAHVEVRRILVQPVTPSRAFAYLRVSSPQDQESWAAICRRWKEGETRLQVLDTPHMLSLARENYGALRSPTGLLDVEEFPSASAIRDSLLEATIARAYGTAENEVAARARLSWLASEMHANGLSQFQWWTLRLFRPKKAHLTLAATLYATLLTSALFYSTGELGSSFLGGAVIAVTYWITGVPFVARMRGGDGWLTGTVPRMTVVLLLVAGYMAFLKAITQSPSSAGAVVALSLISGVSGGVGIAMTMAHPGSLEARVRAPGARELSMGVLGGLLVYISLEALSLPLSAAPLAFSSAAWYTLSASWTRPPVRYPGAVALRESWDRDRLAGFWFAGLGAVIIGVSAFVVTTEVRPEWVVSQRLWCVATCALLTAFASFASVSRSLATQLVWWLSGIQLKSPRHAMGVVGFLEDAVRRGVLRRSGAGGYEFKHGSVQKKLVA